jgi:prepilin-type processing-associated H-X9-DG protein
VTCGSYHQNRKPGQGHTGGTEYLFADSHVKLQTYYQVRRDDFRMFKVQKPATTFSP